MRNPAHQPRSRRVMIVLFQTLVLAGLGVGAWLTGCSPNDPFDPESLTNIPPVVRMSMAPVDTSGELNPTSYFNRTFNWSGTDQDGWVTEFYVSVRTEAGVPAPWDTTSRTDTTMTFVTDQFGNAEATFLLACRDNRGGVSDTLVQFIPLKNFPPAVNFRSDFEPLINMQRELLDINGDITENPSDAADTTYWNWGPMNFRMFALDLDGQATMDPYYRYTLKDPAEGDPDIIFDGEDPDADPTIGWVQVDFPLNSNEVKEFDIYIHDAPVGPATTLTVAVNDEADADTRFHYSWEVREPAGPVLYIPDNSGPQAKTLYRGFLADQFGEGGWQEYSFWFGYPDHSFVLLETMRKFEAVLWADGGSTSPRLEKAAKRDGVLDQYLNPREDQEPGRLLLISKGVVGNDSKLTAYFLKYVLGISENSSPNGSITTRAGKQALGLQPYLPPMTSLTNFGQGVGLKLTTEAIPKADPIYQMEECRNCYSSYQPWDPYVGMRFPNYATAALASAVTLSFQPEYFNHDQVFACFEALLYQELGVTAP